MRLVYEKPASRWGEALPLGNGQIGAMVYGGADCEEIDLTEHTFYSGEAEKTANQEGAAEAFQKMRKAEQTGDYDQVHQEAEKFIGRRENYGTHLPTGKLYIKYQIEDAVQKYERGLELETGRAWVLRKSDKVRIFEEIRTSHPDKVLMVSVECSGKMDLKLWFEPYNQEGGMKPAECGIRFFADAFEMLHCDQKCGVHLEGALKVVTDGETESDESGLWIRKCTNAQIYLAMETNFEDQDLSNMCMYQISFARCMSAAQKGAAEVTRRHEEDMKQFTGGARLQIEGTDSVSEKIPLMFQYGRYLLFCSSREDSKLPAHLQGIWNDNVACRIGWTCDMHLDINTQMNYWPAEFSGMGFVAEPLYRWIEEKLIPEGRKTARLSYGMKGWVGEIVSNAWGYAAPYWASPIAPCPTGGVWILTHLWEHYLYTRDQRFLEEVFPLIEEAVEFFLEYVYQTESGKYTCGPSVSPENSFLYNGNARQISSGCTYEILMIRELFFIYKKALDILKMPKKEQDIKISEIYENLLPYRVLENGCIAEWDHDLPEADPQHRHTSHLLGLFPFAQITPEETPDLCEAAEKTLQRKLTPSENWEDTGWARSMLMLYEARLQHGEKAYAHICHMMEHLLEPNFMVYHPPTRGAGAFDHVYELDGNTGLCSCIGEMLIQSHRGRIRFLPALPKNWKNGKISSFHARGNLEIDLEWREGVFYRAVLKSEIPQNVSIYLEDANCNVRVEKETEITSQDFIKK